MRIFIISLLFAIFPIFTQAQPSSDKLIRKGVSLHDKGKYQDAITCYKEALKINPSSMSATYEMALTYLQLQDYENALKYSTKVINANFQPLLIDAYCVKSSALAELNKVEQSVKLLNEAIDRCGDEYLLHFNLGISYFKLKNLKMSISHLRKAIEIDTTHPSAFLLYSYALSDSDKWVQSFLSFHFFLLLEPNTERSKDAFGEMYDILTQNLSPESERLTPEDGVNRAWLYEQLEKVKTNKTDEASQYKYFVESSKLVFYVLSQLQDDSKSGLLWDFYVPIYAEILESGYFETYCRYVSASYFPQSLEWWSNNKEEVDKFISWFEDGQGSEDSEEADYGDDLELDED